MIKRIIALCLILIGCLIQSVSVSGHLIGNLAWVSMLRILSGEDVETKAEDFASLTRLVENALVLAPDLPRLQAVPDWLTQYQARSQSVYQNRQRRSLIRSAISEITSNERLGEDTRERLRGLAVAERDIEAWGVLALDAQNQGDSWVLRDVLNQLSLIAPQHSIHNVFVVDDLRLEGYDYLPLSVGLHPAVRLTLHWRTTGQFPLKVDPDSGFLQAGDRLWQVLEGRNILVNGDMEWLPVPDSLPLPLPWKLSFHDPKEYPDAVSLVPNERTLGNTVLRLSNTYTETIIATLLPLEAGQMYLVLGQLRTPHGGVFMVMENVNGINEYPVLLNCMTNDDWQSYAGVFSPVAAEYIGLYLQIRGATSAFAEYDNLGVFEISPPHGVSLKYLTYPPGLVP